MYILLLDETPPWQGLADGIGSLGQTLGGLVSWLTHLVWDPNALHIPTWPDWSGKLLVGLPGALGQMLSQLVAPPEAPSWVWTLAGREWTISLAWLEPAMLVIRPALVVLLAVGLVRWTLDMEVL